MENGSFNVHMNAPKRAAIDQDHCRRGGVRRCYQKVAFANFHFKNKLRKSFSFVIILSVPYLAKFPPWGKFSGPWGGGLNIWASKSNCPRGGFIFGEEFICEICVAEAGLANLQVENVLYKKNFCRALRHEHFVGVHIQQWANPN